MAERNQPFEFCKFPRNVTRTAQYVAVPTKISGTPAVVKSDIMIAKMKSNARTTIAMQALLIEVKRNRITGMNKTDTARKTTISLAKVLIRSVEMISTIES